MTVAFLPDIAAAALVLLALRASNRLRTPFVDRKPCPQTSAAAWSYEQTPDKQQDATRTEMNGTITGSWFPVRRESAC
jgi:hypothetical protein